MLPFDGIQSELLTASQCVLTHVPSVFDLTIYIQYIVETLLGPTLLKSTDFISVECVQDSTQGCGTGLQINTNLSV